MRGVAGEEPPGVHSHQPERPVDLALGADQGGPVGGEVEVEDVPPVGEGLDLVPLGVRIGDADDGRQAVAVPHSPERPVCLVEDQVADAGVADQGPGAAGLHIQREEVPPVGVVGGVEHGVRGRIEGRRGHRESRRPLDGRDAPSPSGGDIDGRDRRLLPRIADRHVQRVGGGVVVAARDRPERPVGEGARSGDRVLADGVEVGLLPLPLPLDPPLPLRLERPAVHLLELRREVRPAPRVAVDPGEEGVVAVAEREVADEAGAVEVGVDPHLEIDRGPLRLEPHHVVDARTVAHHRAEHHLVVGTDDAAQAAVHPGLEIDGDPFQVPPGRVPPRRREIPVQHRRRRFGIGGDLAEEDRAIKAVGRGGFVHREDVGHLVVHRGGHPFGGRPRFVFVGVRLDPEGDVVIGDGACTGVAVVPEVVHQHFHRAIGVVVPELAVEPEGILEAPGHLGDQVRLERRGVDQPHVGGLEGLELRGESGGRSEDAAGEEGEGPRLPDVGWGHPEKVRGDLGPRKSGGRSPR